MQLISAHRSPLGHASFILSLNTSNIETWLLHPPNDPFSTFKRSRNLVLFLRAKLNRVIPSVKSNQSKVSFVWFIPKMTELKFLGMDFSCALGSLSKGEIPEKDCLLPLISKLLGYCIVAASTTVKVPQILKILNHKSVRGLSVVAFELEVIGYTIALAYCLHKGLPFSAYGELAFLLIQAIILVAIIYYFSQPVGTKTWIRALLYCAIAPTILAGQIDPLLFEALYASQHAIFFFARVPQIWENFKNKSTGELSFLTSLMNFGGSMVRVFTSLQEKAPMSVVMGSAIGVLTNGTILSQIIIYQRPQPKKGKKTD